MIFILIIFIQGIYNPHFEITTVEFNSLDSCNSAGKELTKLVEADYKQVKYVCVKK